MKHKSLRDIVGKKNMEEMIERFLSWRLPDDFNPDAGISFKAEYNENTPYPMKHEPTGTNLFNAEQAEQMIRHILGLNDNVVCEGDEKDFESAFDSVQKKVHSIAQSKGWHDKLRNDGELIALIHSELSEALEFLRHRNPKSDHIPDFSGVEEEFADVIIRIMDMAELRGYKVSEAIIAKLEFNSQRSYKHGNKKF